MTSGSVVCAFERKALIRAGLSQTVAQLLGAEGQPPPPHASLTDMDSPRFPPRLRDPRDLRHSRSPDPMPSAGFVRGFPGRRRLRPRHRPDRRRERAHAAHHPPPQFPPAPLRRALLQAKARSPKTRVVYGGVFAWIAALASRDVAGNVLWDIRSTTPAPIPASVAAGDTLYAASKVIAVEGAPARPRWRGRPSASSGEERHRRMRHSRITAMGCSSPELAKKEPGQKIPEKVFEYPPNDSSSEEALNEWKRPSPRPLSRFSVFEVSVFGD